jgi:hypothetical protein
VARNAVDGRDAGRHKSLSRFSNSRLFREDHRGFFTAQVQHGATTSICDQLLKPRSHLQLLDK